MIANPGDSIAGAAPSAPLVVGLGEALWDRLPEGDRPGGAPANFAFHAGQLGDRATVATRVGADREGNRLLGTLADRGLDLSHVQRDPHHPTGSVAVSLAAGQPTYAIAESVAWDFMEMTGDWSTLAASADAVCFGTLSQRSPVSRRTVQAFVERCPVSSLRLFDINLRPPFYDAAAVEFGLEHAAVLKLNADEIGWIAGHFGWKRDADDTAIRLLARFSLRMVALTRGADGCELFIPGMSVVSRPPPVVCKDAVGAGDAFSAALVTGLLRGASPKKIADFANCVGAHVAGESGAMPKFPAETIERWSRLLD